MKLRQPIHDIFFDLDRTLWDFDANSRETLTELFQEYQLSERSTYDCDFFIERYMIHNELMWQLFRQNKISKGYLRSVRFFKALEDVGISDRGLAKKLGEHYMQLCPYKSRLRPNAQEVLHTLSATFRLHIITNGFQSTQHIKLESAAIRGYFNEIITSEKAKAKKPDAKIFEFALKTSGASAVTSLMVGDDLKVDVEGALNMGFEAIHYRVTEQEPSTERSIRNLAELIQILN